MVHNSRRPSMDADGWLREPLSLDGADAGQAIAALNDAYKSLPAPRTEAFLEFCAAATGSGRCDQSQGRDLWMTWEMAAEMRAAGMGFGGHTVNHPVLARLDPAGQEREIAGCRDRLRAEIGVDLTLFSYPVGLPQSFDQTTKDCLRRHGVRLAFSLSGGHQPPDAIDRYDVPRASVGLNTTIRELSAMLTLPQLLARW
jgi:hypothetical protein